MQIPNRLLAVLSRNQSLDGAVRLSISHFEPWIINSRLPFFPEYTNHGIDHLEQVLATASSLIRDEAWNNLTSEDAAVLILSVLLHDCAMHLSESAFVALLSDPWRDRSLPIMGDPSWEVLWEEFLGEASRFDGRKLKSLFGNLEPARRPPLDPLKMDMRDRMLIGEFLRRHHPRLAHEIAVFGVPGSSSKPLALQGFDRDIAELGGIVARSHGTHIRSLIPVIEKRYGQAGRRECRGAHPAFLMAVLRIADYVQVQAERAPEQSLRVTRLLSPASQREWKAHHAIRDIRQSIDDPEAIYIEAHPHDVEAFFKVEEWCAGIQRELDESWAVLGEVYGRVKELASLGLVIRRVRTNLEDVESLRGEMNYLPVRANFRAADADLLKLLVGPLYGNDPAIGMRELMQNAVDAVRELGQLLADRGHTTQDVDLSPQDADVVCSIEKDAEGQYWVTVSDRGIGMSESVIINYFLNAGASFRRSDDWKKSFESSNGGSKVLRAGRFGVGALAAFLLGSEIHVTTRHIDDSHGLSFSATVETEMIQISRFNRPVGTTIRIPISQSVKDSLQDDDLWDWYVLTSPSLKRTVCGEVVPQEHSVEIAGNQVKGWQRIDPQGYGGVYWAYGCGPTFACNGIKIEDASYDCEGIFEWQSGFSIPNVIVNDPDGKLPLNLARSSLTVGDLPFSRELCLDVTKYFCAFALSKLPISIDSLGAAFGAFEGSRFDYLAAFRDGDSDSSGEWFFTTEGIGVRHPWILRYSKCRTAVIIRGLKMPTSCEVLREALANGTAYSIAPFESTLDRFDRWIRAALEPLEGPEETSCIKDMNLVRQSSRIGTRVLMSSYAKERFESGKIPKWIWRNSSVEWEVNGWVMVTVGDVTQTQFPFRRFAEQCSPPDRCSSIVEAALDERHPFSEPPLLVKNWMEVLGQPLVPIDLAERKRQLASAYRNLSGYVDAIDECYQPRSKRHPLRFRRGPVISEDDVTRGDLD